MQFSPCSFMLHGFDPDTFERAVPQIRNHRQQQSPMVPYGFLVSHCELGSFQLHAGVPAPTALLIYLPATFKPWLPTLVKQEPSFDGLLAYYGLHRWTVFGWDLPPEAMRSGHEYLRFDPEPLTSLHNEISYAYGKEADLTTAIGALPVFFVCADTLGVSMLSVDEDWSDEFQGSDSVSVNFKPNVHIGMSEADERKARSKMAAIQAMEPELAELFLEDCRPKLTQLVDLRSKI